MSGRHVIVEADGGSRGNPGPAGYGALVRDATTGAVLHETAGSLGTATNNVAEYQGLIAGLKSAVGLGAVVVEVRMDSKLVVEQMSGRWKVKHPGMRVLAQEAAALVRQLPTVTFTHVPRERNAAADRLANEAMDAAAAGLTWRAGGVADRVLPADDSGVPLPEPAPNRLSGWMAAPAPPTVTWLLRHGQTPLSVERRFSGLGDAALTPLGEEQARAAASRLADAGVRFDAVVSSPLRRARQTAAAVSAALGVEAAVMDELREVDFGDWEGLTFAEVRSKWPDDLTAWLSSTAVAPPGGESFDAAAARVEAGRTALLTAHPDATVLVVSHVTPLKILLRVALSAPLTVLYRLHLDVAGLSVVDWFADGPAVVRLVNDTSHLAQVVD